MFAARARFRSGETIASIAVDYISLVAQSRKSPWRLTLLSAPVVRNSPHPNKAAVDRDMRVGGTIVIALR